MNPPQVYMCFPSGTLLPPPSPYHPSGSSQCTSPKHPVSCIEPELAARFIYDIIHVSIPFSQIIPPSPTHFLRLLSALKVQCVHETHDTFFPPPTSTSHTHTSGERTSLLTIASVSHFSPELVSERITIVVQTKKAQAG